MLNSFEFTTTRPTLDRVKEAVFDKLFMKVKRGVVLDLFGGTGGMGLEALSRGASSVYICDNNPRSIALIKKNSAGFNPPPEVLEMDFKKALDVFKRATTQFDIIFLDPPYDSDCGQESLRLIKEYGLLKGDGVVVFEHDDGDGFVCTDSYYKEETKVYGRVSVSYLTISD